MVAFLVCIWMIYICDVFVFAVVFVLVNCAYVNIWIIIFRCKRLLFF